MQSLVEQCPSDDPDTEVNLGCLLYKVNPSTCGSPAPTELFFLQENRYEEACKKFQTAIQIMGYKPDLSYNIALCHYKLKQYAPALKHIADIIERGIREHPGTILLVGGRSSIFFAELSVGMVTELVEVRSVGNTLILHETALIEAFNLKAAIEFQLKNCQ